MDKKVSIKKRRKYDAGFKSEALKMLNSGQKVSEVARSLGIGENLLYTWKTEVKQSQTPDNQLLETEVEQLRKQLRQTEQERDLLKKAIFILSPKT
jgi:transposase